jgi:internalin A
MDGAEDKPLWSDPAERAKDRLDDVLSRKAAILDLQGIGLTAVPDSCEALTSCPHVTELLLAGNHLSELPEWLGYCQGIRKLDLRNNRLSRLPDSICRAVGLEELRVERNCLRELPAAIGRLSALRELYADMNELIDLPDTVGDLQRLELLTLSHNRLRSLPEKLQDIQSLRLLFLHGNQHLDLPEQILGPNLEQISASSMYSPVKASDILAYYYRLRTEKRPLNEAKLILVGRGGVGKTSLVKRLVSDSFDPQERRTDGIAVSDWRLPLVSHDDANLHLWDFGGQEIMHATHQFFLTEQSLYLVVVEGRQGAEDLDAEYWLSLIDSFATDREGQSSPVIVVLNKTRSVPFDLNRRALKSKYPCISQFVMTDCSDGTGIETLRKSIQVEADLLKTLRIGFPASWVAIKNQVASMRTTVNRSYLKFEEFREICRTNGESNRPAQEALATHLHNLGVALNFKDDPRLRDTHVLDPRWVTDGIYRVLNSQILHEQKGELRLADVASILDEQQYPPNMHRFLFDLMGKFQLCFSFPDDDTHYLVPELLDKQEPSETASFIDADCVRFEYRYPILPEGVLPRFICRTHHLSVGWPRWRSGVILSFEGSEALVKADVQSRKVTIAVRGGSTSRRRLLAVVRSDLERIHDDMGGKFAPVAYVPVPTSEGLAIPYARLYTFEKHNVLTFPEAIDGGVVQIMVRDLLDGVDLDTKASIPTKPFTPVKLFYSYSHADEGFRIELETHLKILQRGGLITEWHDRRIRPGDDWRMAIDQGLEGADLILLLVSADFVASDYCYQLEMKRALERHGADQARVVPIILRAGNYKSAPFASLQFLPYDGTPVTEWESHDAAWRNVSESLETLIRDGRDAASWRIWKEAERVGRRPN